MTDSKTNAVKEKSEQNSILYVLVIGFHHKKGCVIEYCHPSLSAINGEELSNARLPLVWRTLPSIALPDGAHNYDKDTIYFTLPHPYKHGTTVFGVSCYRQIDAEKLTNKSSDVTRGTVQKSVVVLSELPLFGLISCKCEMITSVYFNEFDFSKIDCLIELYDNLNNCVTRNLLKTSEVFLALSPKELIVNYEHKLLILFKLILLEKKVLFYKTPVRNLCTTILTLLSLFPGMIENGGLKYASSSVQPKAALERKFSADIELIDQIIEHDSEGEQEEDESELFNIKQTSIDDEDALIHEIDALLSTKKQMKNSSEDLRSLTPPLLKLSSKECGFPLEIFRKGAFCHPYLSLTYLDILSDDRVRSFVIGATNYLFKQKKNLFDVIIDESKIEINDQNLRKQLELSTEDLRFADFLVKNTVDPNPGKGSKILEGTSWEGGDEWLRYQFKVYLLNLLRSSKCNETSKEYSSFNANFVSAWKETHNYKIWNSVPRPAVLELNPGHPFHGQMSIADVKLKLSQAMFTTERMKKMNNTVNQTGKAVGGAINSAKTAVSSWWSQWNTGTTKSQTEESPSSTFFVRDTVSNITSSLSSISLSSLLRSEAENENSEETGEEKIENK
ncbi:late secretory pathway protein AVL9-like protein [Dinothrombium tinctorium]|uniref:Late secretory pathway protein AVL9-like protein n=1 Tax=Dinothrombium tinctorium TaxID=1965070 RepID=A0A3S3PK99_9ACAR|nr:late secretory pathway protein AVL9-like protein [Dinothrombium tinctorium]RWS14235.1 late secretory pathway protein AVL9-like protein [Dinothrombium tinctorium]RWS15693.1 late secretory pathway protein AVL9-like protein [Dinothrombium tinctorium]